MLKDINLGMAYMLSYVFALLEVWLYFQLKTSYRKVLLMLVVVVHLLIMMILTLMGSQ
jgi:hypothetical protein